MTELSGDWIGDCSGVCSSERSGNVSKSEGERWICCGRWSGDDGGECSGEGAGEWHGDRTGDCMSE